MWWNYAWPMPFVLGPLMMLVFFAFCMLMMFFMMRGMHRHRGDGSAIAILKERFARGEINQADYEERRRTLEA